MTTNWQQQYNQSANEADKALKEKQRRDREQAEKNGYKGW